MNVKPAPTRDKFVAKKSKTDDSVDASEVVRDSLRRRKKQEEFCGLIQIGSSKKSKKDWTAPT